MKRSVNLFVLTLATLMIMGCSVFGNSGVEVAPYAVLEKEEPFEVRHYDSLVLVSTPMASLNEQNTSFSKLFKYISGKNARAQDIAMTAPVFMDQGYINSETMSFVLPTTLSLEEAPKPKDKTIKLHEITNYTVATVTFNGLLKQDNIQKHKKDLESWIEKKELKVKGPAKAAGYNPPFTIPALRRNEVMIEIEKP